MKYDIESVFTVFVPDGKISGITVVKSGNINDTYVITAEDGEMYTLQRINSYVFKDPAAIMSNISRVTDHIVRKLEERGEPVKNRVLLPLRTSDGKTFIRIGGSFWRMYPYICHSVCYNEVSDLRVMTMVGKAFGEFQMLLADFPAETLNETIPDFHNTQKRFAQLYATADEDPCGRAASVKNELEFLRSMEHVATRIGTLVYSGDMMLRVTHNDTKSNNVLLDEKTGEPLAVIDLDTVMQGLAVHDFGDAVRFAANTASEDEADLLCVGLDIAKYEAFVRGFIPPIRSSLSSVEIKNMALGAVTMAAELAARFLQDYIAGDLYFKTVYEKQNYIRARCQMALANDMLLKYDKMCEIVERYA